MGDKVVAVLAVHNEEAMLPYTLKQLESQVDHVVAVLDNCTDKSAEILQRFSKVVCVRMEPHSWRNFRAETKAVGISTSKLLYKHCLILMVDCDVLVDDGSIAEAKHVLQSTCKDAVVLVYRQYSLSGSMLHRFKDECLNLLGRATKKLTRQPVMSGIYLVRSGKAEMGDVASDYETVLPKLNVSWLQTGFRHLRPRYDKHTQKLMGLSRATLANYNLRKILMYSVLTLSPYVASGFLTARLRGLKTVEDGFY